VIYLAHFGLRERPFSNTPDARFVYLGTRHEKAIAHLLGGVQAPGGFVHLTGEAGNGKTTVCRLLLNRLSPGVDVALILNPVLTPGELLAAVCDELGVKHEGQESSWTKLVEALYRHLLVTHGGGRRTVVIVDEAQNLGVGAFEQVRLLTKLEADGQKLLQVILIGQPELIEVLGRTELHQLPEPISSGYHLLPFEEAETYAYVRHRLGLAGAVRDIFEIDALRDVHRLSGGVPRLINVICDRALRGAHTQRRATVDQPTVHAAAREALAVSGFQARGHAEEVRQAEEATVAQVPAPPVAPTRRPLWPWLVSVALVINALGIVIGAAFVVTRPWGLAIVGPRPAAVEKTEAPTVTAAPAAPAPVGPASAAETRPSETNPAELAGRARSGEGGTPPAVAPPARARAAPPAQPRPTTPALANAPEPLPAQPSPQRHRHQAPSPEVSAAPAPPTQPDEGESPFKIDLLVWAADPKERMVYLSGRRYFEGQALDNGAVVEQIFENGIVLLHEGHRIRVQAETR